MRTGKGNGMETERKDGRETAILEGRLLLAFPEGFGRMQEEAVRRRFPYAGIPQEIFSDAEGRRIFTCSILEKPLRDGQVYPALMGIQRIINRAFPESLREQARTFRLAAGTVGWCMFLTGGMECDDCHCMFLLPADGRMVFGSYHFPAEEEKRERVNFLGLLKSIRTDA